MHKDKYIMNSMFTWRVFWLKLATQVVLLAMLTVIMLFDFNHKIILYIILLSTAILLLLTELVVMRKARILEVSKDYLIFNTSCIRAEHIEEISIAHQTVDIKKKYGGVNKGLIRMKLKDARESEQLQNRLILFANENRVNYMSTN